MLSSIQTNVSMQQNQAAFKCKASKVRGIIPDKADRETIKLIMAEPVISTAVYFIKKYPGFFNKIMHKLCHTDRKLNLK